MRTICLSLAAVQLLLATMPVSAIAESGPPQRQLKVYALNGNPKSADISPDETVVVTQVTRLDAAADPSKVKAVELAQLWDFRQQRLIAETTLTEAIADKNRLSDYFFPLRFARFTKDGQLVVIYLNHCVYVLAGNDLHPMRQIPIPGPPPETLSHKYKSVVHTYTGDPKLELFEVSSLGHKAAAIWMGGGPPQMDVYDLDSGKRLREGNTYAAKGLQWANGDQQLVLVAPNTIPCMPPTNQPDLFVVDALSGEVRMQLTTGLLVGGVAVTPDDRAWVVDFDCRGVFTDHAPKMKVFDLHTGKQLHELEGRGTGVRYAVSASRNGDRVVAYTGKMKTIFDWGDFVSYDTSVDEAFSAWNAKSYEGIVTSQAVPALQRSISAGFDPERLRVSAKGGFVLFGTNIYELP